MSALSERWYNELTEEQKRKLGYADDIDSIFDAIIEWHTNKILNNSFGGVTTTNSSSPLKICKIGETKMKLVSYHEINIPFEIEGEIAAIVANYKSIGLSMNNPTPLKRSAEESLKDLKNNVKQLLTKAKGLIK